MTSNVIPLNKPSRKKDDLDSDGGPPMDTFPDECLDIRFAHIDDNIKALRADIATLRGWKLWIAGMGVTTFIGLAAIIISLATYHANVMTLQLSGIQSQMSQYQSQLNAQMQTFSDYVKAVTQPQPSKTTPESK